MAVIPQSRYENRVPKIGLALALKDGRKGRVKCGWYAKGKGGWRIMIELENGEAIQVGLKDLRGVKERGH